MNYCKNCKDGNKKYKGNEPSPKGLGYCAGCMKKENILKKGLDGNMWITKSTGNTFVWRKYKENKTKKNKTIKKLINKKTSKNKKVMKKKQEKKETETQIKPTKTIKPIKCNLSLTKLKQLQVMFDLSFMPNTNNELIIKKNKKINKIVDNLLTNINNTKVFVIEIPITNEGIYMDDFIWSYIELCGQDVNTLLDEPFIIIPLYLETPQSYNKIKDITLYHNNIKGENKKWLMSEFSWNGKGNKPIIYKL